MREMRVPGRVFGSVFDPGATDVPREAGWPTAELRRRGRGFQAVYHVTDEQREDMVRHARQWAEGLSYGVDRETAAEAHAVLCWALREEGMSA